MKPGKGPGPTWDAVVLLAGGKSTRMGREKALLPTKSGPLIARALAAIAPAFREIAISVAAAGASPELEEAARKAAASAGRSIALIPDLRPERGPLAGVEAALASITSPKALFLPVDAAHVSFDLMGALWLEASSGSVRGVVPRWSRGLEPAFAIYSRELLPDIQALLREGQPGLHVLASLPGVRILDLSEGQLGDGSTGSSELEQVFRNLNTPDDYASWWDRGE